ncbi:MAG: hypothetical protein EBT15_08220 [Betaproteobacteria bacterium]|nr:hypothetical protein [Betaproteobacteria bacterium]
MNRNDIIRMAIECQLVTTANRDGIYMEALERFAELVAAVEREACIKACDNVLKIHKVFAEEDPEDVMVGNVPAIVKVIKDIIRDRADSWTRKNELYQMQRQHESS